jgi:hypothetical protein
MGILSTPEGIPPNGIILVAFSRMPKRDHGHSPFNDMLKLLILGYLFHIMVKRGGRSGYGLRAGDAEPFFCHRSYNCKPF